MSTVPMQVISPPAAATAPYGLFSVLTFPPANGNTWQGGGITWQNSDCGIAKGVYAPDCDPVPLDLAPKADRIGDDQPEGFPAFTVYQVAPCRSLVGQSLDEGQAEAVRLLLAGEEARVERTLQTGDLLGGAPYGFASGATTVTPRDPSNAASVIGALEMWAATVYGAQGVLHVTREGAEVLLRAGVLAVTGTRLTTRLGTPVVAGSGYTDTDPAGAAVAAGSFAAYMTGALVGSRSEVFAGAGSVTDGFDTRTNEFEAIAERTYAVGYDLCPGTAYAAFAVS